MNNDHKITQAQLDALAIAFEVLKPLLALSNGTAKQCAFCGTAFIPREPKQHYCSTKCQRDYNNNERRKRKEQIKSKAVVEVKEEQPQTQVKCQVITCGKMFVPAEGAKIPFICEDCRKSLV